MSIIHMWCGAISQLHSPELERKVFIHVWLAPGWYASTPILLPLVIVRQWDFIADHFSIEDFAGMFIDDRDELAVFGLGIGCFTGCLLSNLNAVVVVHGLYIANLVLFVVFKTMDSHVINDARINQLLNSLTSVRIVYLNDLPLLFLLSRLQYVV